MRRRFVLTALLWAAPLTVGVAFAGAARDRVEDVAWSWAAHRPLSPRQARTLATCEAPSPAALTKVVSQDLGVACGERALLRALGDAAAADDALADWLVAQVDKTQGRTRLRVAAAAVRAGSAVDIGALPWSDEERAWLAARVADTDLPADWVDPSTEDRLALLEPSVAAVARRLRAAAAAGRDDDAGIAVATELLGLRTNPMDWPPDERPPSFRTAFDAHGPACATGACEALYAAWLDGNTVDEWSTPTVGAASATPALAGFGRTPAWERAQHAQIERWASWISQGPKPSNRLWRAVGGGAHGPVRVPAAALGRGGPPWLTAWLAQELGRRAGVDVVVMAPEGRPVLQVDGVSRTLAGCGGGAGDVWPADAVLAAALREVGGPPARAVAARLDPVGASDPPVLSGHAAVGQALARRLLPPPVAVAETERARAATASCATPGEISGPR